MKDFESIQPSEVSQDEARSMAKDVSAHLNPDTIKGDSMRIDYTMLRKKMQDDPNGDFHIYEIEKLVPLYLHWRRQSQ